MSLRPLTVISVLTACAVGLGLYHVTYEVQDREDALRSVNRQIAAERESIHVLNAEWSLLNDPARLRSLAERFLGFAPVEPTQIQPFDALPFRAVAAEADTVDVPGLDPATGQRP